MKKRAGFIAITVVSMFFIACGGGGSNPSNSPDNPGNTPAISISPLSANITVGASRVFTVTTRNTAGFTLSAPSAAGCAKSGGNAVACTPSAAGTYAVTVTDTADTTKNATATLTVTNAQQEYRAVTFNVDGNVYATRQVQSGSNLGSNMPASPEKTGYSFIGWNTNQAATSGNFTASTEVTADITIHAIWRITYAVPDVTGQMESAAKATISGTVLSIGAVTYEPSVTVPAGSVISQSPVAGTLVEAGTAVNLTVSLGTITDMFARDMVLVRGGTFMMGCTEEQENDCESIVNNERPVHQVTLTRDYYIGKYEVTQAQWKAVMGADNNPSSFRGDDLPVESVSWPEVQEFITRLNVLTGGSYRLPTEAEWEFAARGGNQSLGYKYSGSNNASEVAWYVGSSGNQTHPVGTKAANELGIHDMSGNVFEWIDESYGFYRSGAQIDPHQPGTNWIYNLFRGGSWYSDARDARVAARGYSVIAILRSDSLGFRLAHSR